MSDHSNIEIVCILPEHYSFFETFDPLDKLELAALPGAFAIGAFDKGENEKQVMPVGLMVVTEGPKSLTCEWIAVAEEYRGIEIGGSMLRMLFEVADKKGYESVSAIFSEKINLIAMNYFMQRFFEKSDEPTGRYVMSASDFIADGEFSAIMPGTSCISLKEAGARIMDEAVDFAKRARIIHALTCGRIQWNMADPDLSLIYTDGEKVSGVLVINEKDDIYTPVLLAGESDDVIDALIAESVRRLKNKKLSGKEICIYVRSRYIAELMEDIIGSEDFEKEGVLTAKVGEYTTYRDSLDENETGEAEPVTDTEDRTLIDGLLDFEFFLNDFQ